MADRKLLLIIILVLVIAVLLLSFYFFKGMFSYGNNANSNLNDLNQQGEHQDKSPSTSKITTENNNSKESKQINEVIQTNQSIPVNNDGNDISPNPTVSNSNSSENNTENNEPTNEVGSVTPVPALSDEDENKAPNSIDPTATPTPTPSKNMLNILFLGIDRTEEREVTRISSAADTIMLARVDMDNKTMKVLSIPRDTYAYIPIADKMDKINSSYAYGALQGKAIKGIKDAIRGLLRESCKIDYYFTLDMEPVPDIIDDLGGVEINVEIDMQSHGVNLLKGLQVLDGKSAYDYIRWRYADDGDIGRIRRQQGFVWTMFKKLQASDMEKELLRIILSYGDYINTDLGLEQIDNIIKLCAGIREEDIQFYVLPGEGKTMEEVSYWMVNEEKMKKVLVDFFN